MQEARVIKNVALVLQGGGTRGAFTAGVLDVLMENHIEFSYVIGTSAGALNAVNYVSGDIGRSKFVTTELMSDKKFVSFRNLLFRGTIFDFAYLFHTVPQTKLPFNSARFNSSPVEFVVVASDMKNGEPRYFKKGICKEFYKALAASSSLPLLAKPIDVEGEKFLDGGVEAAIPFRKPLEDGFNHVVVVETRAKGYRKKNKKSLLKRFLAWVMYPKYKDFRKAYHNRPTFYNQDADEIDRLEKEGNAFVIAPATPPEVGLVEKNKDNLLRLYEQGREVMNAQLPSLLKYVGRVEREQKR